jgi:SWI/SNF-related matrix-associated actin-dependent regulator of chromatin subfamily A3
MSSSCIRRTKEMQDDDGNRLVPLPPVNFYSIRVDLHENDRKAYDLAMAASKRKFEEFLANDRTGAVSLSYGIGKKIPLG